MQASENDATLRIFADGDGAAVAGGSRIGEKQVAELLVVDLDGNVSLNEISVFICCLVDTST